MYYLSQAPYTLKTGTVHLFTSETVYKINHRRDNQCMKAAKLATIWCLVWQTNQFQTEINKQKRFLLSAMNKFPCMYTLSALLFREILLTAPASLWNCGCTNSSTHGDFPPTHPHRHTHIHLLTHTHAHTQRQQYTLYTTHSGHSTQILSLCGSTLIPENFITFVGFHSKGSLPRQVWARVVWAWLWVTGHYHWVLEQAKAVLVTCSSIAALMQECRLSAS